MNKAETVFEKYAYTKGREYPAVREHYELGRVGNVLGAVAGITTAAIPDANKYTRGKKYVGGGLASLVLGGAGMYYGGMAGGRFLGGKVKKKG